MRWGWLLIGMAACGFKVPEHNLGTGDGGAIDSSIDGPPDAVRPDGAVGAARKKTITIDPALVFGNQTNFPVWILIDGDNDLRTTALADGSDLYFTAAGGGPLEHQIQRWDKAAGRLEAWVRADLDDLVATKIELHYGDPGPAHAPNPLLVFSNQFAAVWHMDDAFGGATTVADARGQRQGTAANGPTSAAGKLGRGVQLDGTNDQITFTNPLSGNTAHTISAWVNVVAPASGFSCVIEVGNAAGNQARFLHTNYPNVAIGFYGNDLQPGTTGIDGAGFALVHWVYSPNGNAGTSTLYINGLAVATQNHGGTINTTGTAGTIGNAPQAFGPGGNTPNPLHGTLDEVRIATAARSQGWISTEVANQSSPQTFYTVGPAQIGP